MRRLTQTNSTAARQLALMSPLPYLKFSQIENKNKIMKSILFAIFGLICINSCLNKSHSQQEVTLSSSTIDSSLLKFDSITILGNHFSVFYRDNFMLYVVKEKDTLIKTGCNNGFDFEDFNLDGFNDIIIPYLTNVGGIQDVLQFDPNRKQFIRIDNLSKYPMPIRITNNIFYSYQRAGCADNYWISNLFKVEDFRTFCLGEIWGQGCEPEEKKIDIFKVSSDDCKNKQLIKTLPLDTIYKFQDTKWGFIKYYWTNNYSEFIKK